jgi:hypothetical protein
MGLHRDEVQADGLHAVLAFTYPTSADRLADTNRTPSEHPLAVGVLVEQVDTGDIYICTGLGPPTYTLIATAAAFALLNEEPLLGYLESSGGALPTLATWWDSASKTRKLVEATITYAGALPVTLVYQLHDGAGVPTISITETRAYTGAVLSSVTRELTP